MQGIVLYFVLMNAIVFILMVQDKRLAIKHKPRIPERTLLGLSTIGGSIGCLLGMIISHHKVRKSSFYLPLIMILLVQAFALYFLY